MIIKWLGHSCFKLVSGQGTSIVLDPYDVEYTGLSCKKIKADIVSTSHGHSDHNAIHQVEGYDLVISNSGHNVYKDIEIKSIDSFHDPQKGKLRGKNLITVVTIDSLKVCHFGDMGENLTEKQIKEIGQVDIILIPIGGIYTIDSVQSKAFIDILKPKITIPMHYKIENLKFDLGYLDAFLQNFDKSETMILDKSELNITKQNLSDYPNIVVLDRKRTICNK